jgi:hypothetical protein
MRLAALVMVFLVALLNPPAFAQTGAPPSPVGGAQLCNSCYTPFAVGTTSTPIAFPASIPPYSTVTLNNTGTVDAYIEQGQSTVVATLASPVLRAGTSIVLNATQGGYLAAITASGTTNIDIFQATASVLLHTSSANGGGGSPTGPAGGDLSGTYPNPGVARILGQTPSPLATDNAAQATAFLNLFSAGTQGLVPASGGSSTLLYLNQAGQFTSPPGSSCGGNACGTFATQNYATPPIIGGVTPNAAFYSALTDTGITGSIQCLHANSGGLISGTGSDCGSGGGGYPPAGTTGQPQYNNNGVFGAYTAIPLAYGGSGQTTVAGALGCSGFNINCLTVQGDANYQLLATDRAVELGTPFTTVRTDTLPCADLLSAGQGLQIYDPAQNINVLDYLNVIPSSSCGDTLNGSVNTIVNAYYAGSRIFAISNGINGWQVVVSAPPIFQLDFARDFGGVVTKVNGTNSCTITASSANISCSGTPTFTQADVGDIVTADACASGGTLFTSYLVSVTAGTGSAVMHDQPAVNCSSMKMINQINVATGGSGYKFGAFETLVGGSPVAAQVGTPAVLGASSLTISSGGSGGTNGCTALTLNAAGRALQGLQATFAGTISGNALTSVSGVFLTPGSYTSLTGYTYDGSGYYDSIPVTGCGLVGATVNVSFAIQVESLSGAIGVYPISSIPCATMIADTTTSTSHGTGATFYCRSFAPVQWIGHDNIASMQKMATAESAGNAAGAPITVQVNGLFGTSGLNPATNAILGPASVIGTGPFISGFYHIPNTGGDILPIVDSNPNGSENPFSFLMQVNQSGTFIRNLTFYGDTTSSTWDRDVTAYGPMKWATFQDIVGIDTTGHIFGVGGDSTGCGVIEESNFDNIRSYIVGSTTYKDPALGFDAVGCSPGSNNISLIRQRSFDDPYFALTVRPATGSTGNGSHDITNTDPKYERSGLDDARTTAGQILLGCNTDCLLMQWPSTTGTPISGSANGGVSSVFITNAIFANPSVNSFAVIVEGLQQSDVSQIYITGNITAAAHSHGGGFLFNACNAACILNVPQNSTVDYNLLATSYPNAGQIMSGSIEYDAHGYNPVFSADNGINIACDGGNGVLNAGGVCVIGVGNGGTGAITPQAARANLNIDGLTYRSNNLNYQMLATDRMVAPSIAQADRTWSLPCAASVNPGQTLIVDDFQGLVNGTHTITVQPSASGCSDVLNGANSGGAGIVMSTAYQAEIFASDGASRWTLIGVQ